MLVKVWVVDLVGYDVFCLWMMFNGYGVFGFNVGYYWLCDGNCVYCLFIDVSCVLYIFLYDGSVFLFSFE